MSKPLSEQVAVELRRALNEWRYEVFRGGRKGYNKDSEKQKIPSPDPKYIGELRKILVKTER